MMHDAAELLASEAALQSVIRRSLREAHRQRQQQQEAQPIALPVPSPPPSSSPSSPPVGMTRRLLTGCAQGRAAKQFALTMRGVLGFITNSSHHQATDSSGGDGFKSEEATSEMVRVADAAAVVIMDELRRASVESPPAAASGQPTEREAKRIAQRLVEEAGVRGSLGAHALVEHLWLRSGDDGGKDEVAIMALTSATGAQSVMHLLVDTLGLGVRELSEVLRFPAETMCYLGLTPALMLAHSARGGCFEPKACRRKGVDFALLRRGGHTLEAMVAQGATPAWLAAMGAGEVDLVAAGYDLPRCRALPGVVLRAVKLLQQGGRAGIGRGGRGGEREVNGEVLGGGSDPDALTLRQLARVNAGLSPVVEIHAAAGGGAAPAAAATMGGRGGGAKFAIKL